MVISIRPWPGISVFPVQVPTRDFSRSNSGELLRVLSGSAAFKPTTPASSNIAQTEVILVFIVFLFVFGCFSLFISNYTYTTNEEFGSGHGFLLFFGESVPANNGITCSSQIVR